MTEGHSWPEIAPRQRQRPSLRLDCQKQLFSPYIRDSWSKCRFSTPRIRFWQSPNPRVSPSTRSGLINYTLINFLFWFFKKKTTTLTVKPCFFNWPPAMLWWGGNRENSFFLFIFSKFGSLMVQNIQKFEKKTGPTWHLKFFWTFKFFCLRRRTQGWFFLTIRWHWPMLVTFAYISQHLPALADICQR